MFQYALALKMQNLGIQVKIDVTKYADHHAHNDFELDRVFGINGSFAELSEIRSLGYVKANHWTEFLKKTPFRKKTVYNHESYTFDEQVLKLNGYYVEGYWQSERYFSDIRGKILETYQFPKFSDGQQACADRIRKTCSVGVHIRRGDYLEYSYLQNICTLEYYRKAMEYMRRHSREKVEFYIFTNDFSWAEAHFTGEDCHFVKGNTGMESFRDMQLMSICHHNIVANSSFSWWAAWLNRNPRKIVVAPDRWINGPLEESKDVIPGDWVRISGHMEGE